MTRAATRAASLRDLAQRRERRSRALAKARTSAARAVRVVRPVTWALGVSAVLCALIGLSLGWRELMITAAVIAVVFLLSSLFLLGGTAYAVGLTLTQTRVVAGERAYGELTLGNTTDRTLPAARIVLPVGPGRGAFDVPRLAAGDVREELFSIPTAQRGVIEIGPVSVLRGDPLGLFERIASRGEAVTLYVHPQTVPVHGLSLGGVRDLEGLPTTELSSDDVSFHALREYQSGDDLRHVHWRSTARTGAVMMRQYEQTRRSTFLIGISTRAADYADADEFELAVSLAASVGLRALSDSPDVVMLVPGRRLPMLGAQRMLDDLASISTARGAGNDAEAIAIEMATHPAALALAVIVTGSQADARTVRKACLRVPAGVRTLVLQSTIGGTASLRQVGDAQIVDVGALADLPAAMRRVLA